MTSTAASCRKSSSSAATRSNPLRKGLVGWLKGNGYITDLRRTIIDIGANIGTPSVQHARETGLDILAIEPDPANFELLTKNVAQNGLDGQVRCVRAAVSMRPGTLKMAVPKERATCEVVEEGKQPGFGELTPDIPIIEVPSLRLETILSVAGIAPERVAVVWCDAQGLEREIIESAPGLWRAGVPLYLELWPKGILAHGGTDAFHFRVAARSALQILRDDFGDDEERCAKHDWVAPLANCERSSNKSAIRTTTRCCFRS